MCPKFWHALCQILLFSTEISFPLQVPTQSWFPSPRVFGGLAGTYVSVPLKVPPLNRVKTLQSSASTSGYRPRYQEPAQDFHLRGGKEILSGEFMNTGVTEILVTPVFYDQLILINDDGL